MCDDDAALACGTFEHIEVRLADQLLVPGGSQIVASSAEASNNLWSDVLVCQEREVERRHAVILNSQVCSPFSASAAYRNAAEIPSAVS